MVNDKIKFFALGGLDEQGKNLYVVEVNDKIFILDAGFKYPSSGIPGVDLIIPSFKYLQDNKDRVKAYIISHAHYEEMGAVPFMYKYVPAPIYCSKFTKEALEQASTYFEMKNDFVFHLIDNELTTVIDGVKFGFSHLTHSIPGSYSVKIYTSQGTICYIADFICDPTAQAPFQTDYKHLEFGDGNNNYLALIIGSENSTRPGYTIPKHRVYDLLLPCFEESAGKILISNNSHNLFNLKEIVQLCDKFNKTIFIYCKSGTNSEMMFYQKLLAEYNMSSPKTKFGAMSEINRTREQDIVILFLGNYTDIYETITSFILNQSHDLRIELSNKDVFINNTQPMPLKEVKATETLDLIYKTNMRVFNISKNDRNLLKCSEEDIKQYITFINPKYFIPVDGYFFQMMASAKSVLNTSKKYNYSNIFLLENGVILNFENGIAKADYKNKIETSDLFIDGIDIGNVGNNVVEERSQMSNDGIVLMGVTVSRKSKSIIGGPDVQMRGFVFLKDSENILREITNIFLDNVRTYLTGFYDNKQQVLDKIVEQALRYIRRETGKNPVIMPEIIEID